MPTKNIVPRATDEGEIGTSAKRWEKVHAKTGSFDYIETTTMSSKMYNDGSTIFGDDASDTHEFNGDININSTTPFSQPLNYGSLTVEGPIGGMIELQAANSQVASIYTVTDDLKIRADDSIIFGPNNDTNGRVIFKDDKVGIGQASAGGPHIPVSMLDVSGSTKFGVIAGNLHEFTGTVNIEGDLEASINISASAFYGDGQYLTNLPSAAGTLQDVTDLGSVTTNNITASGYYLGSSGEGIHDEEGTMRIDLQTTSQNAMILRAAENTNAGITGMQNLQINNENGKLAKIQTGKNTAGIRHLNIIDTSHHAPADPNHVARTGSDRGVMFATDITASFINLELRSTEDDSFSALDLVKHNGLGIADTDYFGEAAVSGFRLRYMEDDLQLKIRAGNGATVNDRMAFDRDEDHVIIGGSDTTNLNSNWAALAINSDSGFGGFVSFEQAGTQKAAIFSSNDDLTIKADAEINFQPANISPSPMVLDIGGNLGIGTIAPEVPLDIYNMGGLTLAQSNIQNDSKGYWDVNPGMNIVSSSLGTNFLKCDVTMPANGHMEIETTMLVQSVLGASSADSNQLDLALYLSGTAISSWTQMGDSFFVSTLNVQEVFNHINGDGSENHLKQLVTARWVIYQPVVIPAGTNFSVAIGAAGSYVGAGTLTLRYCDAGSGDYYPPLTIKALTSVVPDTAPGNMP